MEKRMNKEQLLELIESLKISKEEFCILSTSALVLRDLFDSAGDLDIAVTEKGLEELKSNYDLISGIYNGWYIVNDKVECVLNSMVGKKEKVGEYYVQSLTSYLEFLEETKREKDKIKYEIVKRELEHKKVR